MMRLSELKIMHLTNPLGIDETPYFSWKIESDERNVFQTSYRISVLSGNDILWDSGIVQNDQQSFLPYQGDLLESTTRYEVRVSVTDNQGHAAEATGFFETGLLDKALWKAQWIGSTVPRNENKAFTYGIENPPVVFEKTFHLPMKVSKARLYATCYGTYRAYVNGARPDDREFAPEFTPYDKILNYQTYDVTGLLKEGENHLSFLVGDGWFFCDQTKIVTDLIVPSPAVLFQIEMTLDDGKTMQVCSDGTETCHASDIVFSDLFMGEKVDKTRVPDPARPVEIKAYGYDKLRCQPIPPVKIVETFPARRIYTSPKGETIVDFGQVIAGRTRVKLHVPTGRSVTLEHTEIIDKDGNYVSAMIARQCDTYVSDGEATVFEPLFTFHGFRYVRVTGIDNPIKEDFTAVLLSTEKDSLAEFSCSDERVNRLYKNIRYSQKNNMMSVPTDCPTREKAGWSGDILIYAKTALYNEDVTPFLSGWLTGLMADQLDSGVIPLISPLTEMYKKTVEKTVKEFGDREHTGIAGWSDAILWVPFAMYQVTGNKLILEKCFDAMQKWCDYVIKTSAEKRGSDMPESVDRYLWNTGFHFGEWLVPGKSGAGFDICKETSSYIAPYFAYKSMVLMSEIADILGRDGGKYRFQAAKIKWAIDQAIFKRDRLPADYQGGYVLAFAFDLVPEELYLEYKNRLIRLVEDNGDKLGTGFLATPFLLDVLDQIGRHDLAEKIFWQSECPSWLYEVDRGATTIWENWQSVDESGNFIKSSYDHYAYGVVDDWIMRSICGIRAGAPGYKHIVIHPVPSSKLSHVHRSFNSEYGIIEVEIENDALRIIIPCNTTATVVWNGHRHEIGNGKYAF